MRRSSRGQKSHPQRYRHDRGAGWRRERRQPQALQTRRERGSRSRRDRCYRRPASVAQRLPFPSPERRRSRSPPSPRADHRPGAAAEAAAPGAAAFELAKSRSPGVRRRRPRAALPSPAARSRRSGRIRSPPLWAAGAHRRARGRTHRVLLGALRAARAPLHPRGRAGTGTTSPSCTCPSRRSGTASARTPQRQVR